MTHSEGHHGKSLATCSQEWHYLESHKISKIVNLWWDSFLPISPEYSLSSKDVAKVCKYLAWIWICPDYYAQLNHKSNIISSWSSSTVQNVTGDYTQNFCLVLFSPAPRHSSQLRQHWTNACTSGMIFQISWNCEQNSAVMLFVTI